MGVDKFCLLTYIFENDTVKKNRNRTPGRRGWCIMGVSLTTKQRQAFCVKLREAVEGGGRSSGLICLELRVRFLSQKKAQRMRDEDYFFTLWGDLWVVTRVSVVEVNRYGMELRRR